MRASWCGASVLRYLITVLKQLGISSLTGTSYLSLFIYCSSPLPSFSTEHVFSTLCELTTLCLRFLIYVSSHRGDFLHCFPLLCPTTSGSPKPQPRTLDSWGKEMFKRCLVMFWCYIRDVLQTVWGCLCQKRWTTMTDLPNSGYGWIWAVLISCMILWHLNFDLSHVFSLQFQVFLRTVFPNGSEWSGFGTGLQMSCSNDFEDRTLPKWKVL